MQRLLPLACGLAAVIAAGACGARSTMATGDEASSGGGSTGVSQGGSITSQTTNVVTSTSVVTSGTTTTSTTSTTTGGCDNTGDCQICAECAQFGRCSDEIEDCFTDMDCQAFADCFGMCQGTPGCFPGCASDHPMGVQLYIAALQCILCDECPIDCDDFTPPMLCDF